MILTENNIKLSYSQNEMKLSTHSPFDANSDFTNLNSYFSNRPLDDLLWWCLSTFGDKITQVTSFGPTGMIILDRLAKLSPGIRVITIDTNFLFEETYSFMDQIQRRYPIQLDIRQASLTPEAQAQVYQPNLWQANPDLCCYLRKVIPLGEALQGVDAWITGLRRDQSPTRMALPLVSWDAKYNLVKINPLAHWTRDQVWAYILINNIPYNPLHNRGYASIGCTHCTCPIINPLNERSGRWQGHPKIECGIHV
jgi:phosphoadenosine phosphosulfate reductase